jgi:UPF0755 protein
MSTEVSHYKDKKPPAGLNEELIIETDRSKKHKLNPVAKYLYGLAAILLLSVLLGFAWLNFALRPLSQDAQEYKYVEIKQGQGISAISKQIATSGVIRSWLAFDIAARMDAGSTLQAGYYKFSSSMTTEEILSKIQKGQTDAFSITIPEGYRVLQIAKLLKDKAGIDPTVFIGAAIGSEGYLFPDTYVFPVNIEPATIVSQMKENYEKRTNTLNVSEEQLIIASIVEREAIKDDERAKIAAVYKNRADEGMLLQADPTVAYARDTQEYLTSKSVDFKFWTAITKADYQSLSSPFNTYKNKGLPPAPICNPGLKSLQAAVNPEPNFDYLFFFHDTNREIHFSKTYQEHLEAINKYGVSS